MLPLLRLCIQGVFDVFRTAVIEERYTIRFQGANEKVYASDHLPVVADIFLSVDSEDT